MLNMTTVVNKYKDDYDVYIGRGSKWGNPYPMKNNSEEERKRVIDAYINYFWTTDLIEDIYELKDKRLGCFCHPKPCHGDFLAFLANNNIVSKEDYEYAFYKQPLSPKEA